MKTKRPLNYPNILAIIVIAIFATCGITSCCTKKRNGNETIPERIKVITTTGINGSYSISIVEIDGHIYASKSNGGLTHLESCHCKKH